MEDDPIVSSLISAGLVRAADIEKAVESYLSAPDAGPFVVSDGYCLDVEAAVAARPYSTKFLQQNRAGKSARRAAVRTAILLAKPIRIKA